MNIIVVHGYLLAGTGSNLYVANLCRALAFEGHTVFLLCQEQHPERFSFVSRFEQMHHDNMHSDTVFHRDTDCAGEVRLLRPHIAGELPVYVHDEYENLTARLITDMSTEELEAYVQRNARALATCLSARPFDLIISNHLIMQPVCVRRALTEATHQGGDPLHRTIVHGSALNFAVRKSDSLRDYALDAIDGSDELIFVSSHSREEFLEQFPGISGLRRACRVIPPGVDAEGFRPLPTHASRSRMIDRLSRDLTEQLRDRTERVRSAESRQQYLQQMIKVIDQQDPRPHCFRDLALQARSSFTNWAPDEDAAVRLPAIDWARDDIVVYFGKYLWGKGVQLLVAAAPLILERRPRARFVLVGFGSSREILEAMVHCLDEDRRRPFRNLIAYAEKLDPDGGGSTGPALQDLLHRLDSDDFSERYFGAARHRLAARTTFTGIMNHSQLQLLVPCADVVVAPSINSEAFGLVAVEALASGIIPLLNRHSGFRDTIDFYAQEFADIDPHDQIAPLHHNENYLFTLANNVDALLRIYDGMSEDQRSATRERAHQLAARHFSWNEVARELTER